MAFCEDSLKFSHFSIPEIRKNLYLALGALWWIRRAFKEGLPALPLKVLLTATLFFALSCVLLLQPVEFL